MDKTGNISTKTIRPPYLKKGDKIAITCTAFKLPKPMNEAIKLLESWALEVILGETTTTSFHQFAGDDELRARDMQRFIDDDSIKAIVAAFGGYGTSRMVDKVDFTRFAEKPKWLIGYSDITSLHAHVFNNCRVQTIHAPVPVNISDVTQNSLQTLKRALFGEPLAYEFISNDQNKTGEAMGIVVGGNLSSLIYDAGSLSEFDYNNKILFIEDRHEYKHNIDRMMRTLDRAGKLKNLQGLIVGGFTETQDLDIPFGKTVPEIIIDVAGKYNYPICFDFPAGHVPDNCSIIMGSEINLNVGRSLVKVIHA
jgi:muramoyltetrapeptide carboxypeptidase